MHMGLSCQVNPDDRITKYQNKIIQIKDVHSPWLDISSGQISVGDLTRRSELDMGGYTGGQCQTHFTPWLPPILWRDERTKFTHQECTPLNLTALNLQELFIHSACHWCNEYLIVLSWPKCGILLPKGLDFKYLTKHICLWNIKNTHWQHLTFEGYMTLG